MRSRLHFYATALLVATAAVAHADPAPSFAGEWSDAKNGLDVTLKQDAKGKLTGDWMFTTDSGRMRDGQAEGTVKAGVADLTLGDLAKCQGAFLNDPNILKLRCDFMNFKLKRAKK